MSSTQGKLQARSLIQSGHLEEAMSHLYALYKRDVQDAEVWHLLATVNGQLGRFDDAATWSRRVIEKYPRQTEAWMNLAAALLYSGDHEYALDAYECVLQLDPANVQARLAVADLYHKSGNQSAALHNYREAARLMPQAAVVHYNLGNFLQETTDYAQAEDCYLKALELEPGLVQARNNLGLIYQEQCRFDEAMQHFDAALKHEDCNCGNRHPDLAATAEVHRHRALLRLLRGEFEPGWAEYEWRHTDPVAVQRDFASPDWDGSPLVDGTILVAPEQGIGDEIMFASCIPDLQRRAGKVILECNPRLEALFTRSFPGVEVRGRDPVSASTVKAGDQREDVHVFAGSLPRYFRATLADFPGKAYLAADPEKVRIWRKRYRDARGGVKVGISWRGGAVPRVRSKRSTDLQQWLGLLRLQGVQFISLQYGDCAAELLGMEKMHGVRVWDFPDADPLMDLDDFAAKVAALDMVVSVDNASVHLAGALGLPVWILQTYSPEWRWLLGREDSCWYPNVRQFRQPSLGDWLAVFESVRRELLALPGVCA